MSFSSIWIDFRPSLVRHEHTALPHGNERGCREGSREKTRAGVAQQNQGGTGDADVDPGTVQSFHHICFQQPDNDRGAYGSQPFRSPSVRASASALPPGRRLPRQAEGRSHHVSLRAQYGRSTTGSVRYQLLFTNSPTSDASCNFAMLLLQSKRLLR